MLSIIQQLLVYVASVGTLGAHDNPLCVNITSCSKNFEKILTMVRFFSLFLFGLPLLAMAASVENQEANRIHEESMIGMEDLDAETLAMLRGSSSSEDNIHGRQLWGFSFTNLLCK